MQVLAARSGFTVSARASPRTSVVFRRLVRPFPVGKFRLICAKFMSIVTTLDLHVPESGLGMSTSHQELGYALDHVHSYAEAVYLVVNCQLQWGVDVSLLLVATHVHIIVIGPAVCQPVNQPGITVEVENHRLIQSKQAIEVSIAHAVWVLAFWLEPE